MWFTWLNTLGIIITTARYHQKDGEYFVMQQTAGYICTADSSGISLQ